MHETDGVEDSGIYEMSTFVLNFAVTFSQPGAWMRLEVVGAVTERGGLGPAFDGPQ